MYRINAVVEVQYGHFAEVLRCYEEMNEISQARGWKECSFWVPTAGRANELICEWEYESLDQYTRETEACGMDAAYMKVMREAAQYCVQGTARTRIYEQAPHLA